MADPTKRGRVIEFARQFPSDNLVVIVVGFAEFVQSGLRGFYELQIENLLARGYDV